MNLHLSRPSPHQGRKLVRLALVFAISASVSTHSVSAHAAPVAPIDPKRIFAQSEPATVLILSDFSADTTTPEPTLNEDALKQQLVTDVLQGQLNPDDEAAIVLRSLDLIIASPETFLMAGPLRQAKAQFQATGSGFIIDESGYIVTNAHVAAPHDDEIKQQLAEIGLKSFIEEDARGLAQDLQGQISETTFNQLVSAEADWLAARLQISNLQKSVSAVLGANIPGVSTSVNIIPGVVVAAGDPIPGRDVAVLKVEQKNLPTLKMGDDAPLRPGDKLFVLGYPGAATFHPLISKESITEPSFTSGQMSARKQSTGGFEVLQTDAAVTHGNSGGPVFNDKGEVVGIATFGSISQGQTELAGFNFIMPATLIKQFVDRSGAHPAEGIFTKLYNKALDAETAGEAKVALATFTEINQLAPGHPYVQQHIAADQGLVSSGQGGAEPTTVAPSTSAVSAPISSAPTSQATSVPKKTSSSNNTGLIAGGGAAVVALFALIVALAMKTRRKSAPTAMPAMVLTTPAAIAPASEHVPMAAPSAPHSATSSSTASRAFCGSCGVPLTGKAFCGSCGQAA